MFGRGAYVQLKAAPAHRGIVQRVDDDYRYVREDGTGLTAVYHVNQLEYARGHRPLDQPKPTRKKRRQ